MNRKGIVLVGIFLIVALPCVILVMPGNVKPTDEDTSEVGPQFKVFMCFADDIGGYLYITKIKGKGKFKGRYELEGSSWRVNGYIDWGYTAVTYWDKYPGGIYTETFVGDGTDFTGIWFFTDEIGWGTSSWERLF